MKTYLLIYSGSLLLSVALTPLAIWLGKRLGLTDTPDLRKVHTEPIPRIGGLAVYISVICVVLPALLLPNAIGDVFRQTQSEVLVLLVGATAVFLLGLTDDIRGLRARTKLLVQVAAATLVYFGGIRIGSIAVGDWVQVDLGWFAWPATVFWIVGITNAVNLSDGMDGLASGISTIACGVIAILAVMSGQVIMAVMMFAMLGALTGFLRFNFNPARVFLGDSGSLFLGFMISASSVMCFMKSHAFVALALPAVALGIPILDTLLTVLRRFLARRPIFAPDRNHFHHQLLRLGLRQRHVVVIIYVATLLVTSLGMFMLLADGRTGLVLLGSILVFLLILFRVVGAIRLGEAIVALRRRLDLRHQTHEEIDGFCSLQLQFDHARSPRAWWQALCSTADQLDFAWVSMTTTDREGNAETSVWRRPGAPSTSARVTIIRVPVQDLARTASIEVEAAVLTNGSIEGATRRASLFGRLMDEYKVPTIHEIASGRQVSTDRTPLTAKRPHLTQLPVPKRLDSAAEAAAISYRAAAKR
ncbi:MAG: undecaprenyl/decaprenyl-phosphate alpha-N-acetylglucosaminyl 1-phosphate transferase [Phycisphaerales bacterium]|nr:MAG: undecaprenyl/decaprenyl-phosphate alpha-N-acetylglucosaminyl 1-phosphate transferase [Phycisphaerales bacterium]